MVKLTYVSQPHGWAVVSFWASRCSVTVLLNLESASPAILSNNVRLSLSTLQSTFRITRVLPLHLYVLKVDYIYMLIYKIKPHYLRLTQINTIHHQGTVTRMTALNVLLNLDSVFASHIVKLRMNIRHSTSSSTFRITRSLSLHFFVFKVGNIYMLIYKIKQHYLRSKQINTLHLYGNITQRMTVNVLLNLDSVFACHIVKLRMNIRHSTSSSTFRITHLLSLHLFVLKVGYIYILIHKKKPHYLRVK